MSCSLQLIRINSVKQLQKGDLLVIFSASNEDYKNFSKNDVYEVKDVNNYTKYIDPPENEFAELYVYTLEIAKKDNPKLFASNYPLHESEINKKVEVYKIIK